MELVSIKNDDFDLVFSPAKIQDSTVPWIQAKRPAKREIFLWSVWLWYFYDQYVCNYGCRENEWPRVEKQSCYTHFLYIFRLFSVKARNWNNRLYFDGNKQRFTLSWLTGWLSQPTPTWSPREPLSFSVLGHLAYITLLELGENIRWILCYFNAKFSILTSRNEKLKWNSLFENVLPLT